MYHCTVKKFSRGKGQSATAAAAYRAGAEIEDERTGEVHDYTRRSGVVSSHIVLPDQHPEWARDRSKLWSGAEQAETRKNSVVAREVEIGLPAELSAVEREELATDFAAHLVDKYSVAAEVSIHEPSRQGDQRNHHAHVLFTTRRMDENGFTEKTRELDDKRAGPQEIEAIRKDWEEFQNQALERAGQEKRVDCRSLATQREEALGLASEYEKKAAVNAPYWEAPSMDLRPKWAEPPKLKPLEAVYSDPDARVEGPSNPDKWKEQAEAMRRKAENLNREPGQHQGPARTEMNRRVMQRIEQMRDGLQDRVDRLQEAFRERLDTVRAKFEDLKDRLQRQEPERAKGIQSERPGHTVEDKLQKLREDRQESKSANEGRSVAERLREIRDADRDREAELRKRRDRGHDFER